MINGNFYIRFQELPAFKKQFLLNATSCINVNCISNPVLYFMCQSKYFMINIFFSLILFLSVRFHFRFRKIFLLCGCSCARSYIIFFSLYSQFRYIYFRSKFLYTRQEFILYKKIRIDPYGQYTFIIVSLSLSLPLLPYKIQT